MKPAVLVDLDGVCADYLSFALARLQTLTGRAMTLEDVTSYDLESVFGEDWPRLKRDLESPGTFTKLRPLPGAPGSVVALQRANYEVFICSSPGPSRTAAGEKWAWVCEHLPTIDHRHIILTNAKEMVRADVLIDDSPIQLRKYAHAWPRSRRFAPRYAYNVESVVHARLFGDFDGDIFGAWIGILTALDAERGA